MTSEFFRRLKPFILISIVFGFTGCKIVSGRLKPSRTYPHRVRVVIIAIIVGAITYKVIKNFTDNSGTSFSMRNLLAFETLEIYKAWLSCLSLFATLFIGTYHQSAIIAFIQNAEKYDKKVELLGHKKKNEFLKIWLNLIIEFIVTVVRIRNLIYRNKLPMVWRILKLICETLEDYMAFDLCLQMYLLLVRFRHLNDTLIPKLLTTHTHQRESFVLCQVKNLHSTLFNMASNFNGTYDAIIITWGLEALIDAVAIYSVFNVPTLKLVRIVCFIALCDRVSKESQNSGYHAMRERRTPTCSSDNEMWMETALYFHYHKVEFTVWNILRLRQPTLLLILNETILVYLLKLSVEDKNTDKASRIFVN